MRLNLGERRDSDILSAAYWITTHGPGLGIRVPNVGERARALALYGYMERLRLPEQVLFNAQGNIFDKDALNEALYYALFAWLSGVADIPRHTYRAYDQLLSLWSDYLAAVSPYACPPQEWCRTPTPSDLMNFHFLAPRLVAGFRQVMGSQPDPLPAPPSSLSPSTPTAYQK